MKFKTHIGDFMTTLVKFDNHNVLVSSISFQEALEWNKNLIKRFFPETEPKKRIYRMIQLDDKWSLVLPSSGLDSLILLVSQQSGRLIAAYAYTIYSFDIDNGDLAWKYEAEEPINDLHQEDNFLIVQTETGLIKLDADGFIIWTFDLGEIILKVSLEDGSLIVEDFNNRLYHLSSEKGLIVGEKIIFEPGKDEI